MAIQYLNGKRLIRAIDASSKFLTYYEKELNEINVFPVPDGDTGYNMTLTLRKTLNHVLNAESGNFNLPSVASRAASGALEEIQG